MDANTIAAPATTASADEPFSPARELATRWRRHLESRVNVSSPPHPQIH